MKKMIYSMLLFCSLLSSAAFAQNNFLDFDGGNDYVTIPSSINSDLNLNNAITVEAYINYSSAAGASCIVTEFWDGSPNTVRFGIYHSGSPTSWLAGYFAPGWKTTSFTIPLNTWTHVAATFDGSDIKVYINGTLASTANFPGILPMAASDWRIGRRWDLAEYITGQIDEVRIWNVARTPTEIAANYTTELTGNEPGLVVYYNMNQGTCGENNTPLLVLTDNSIPGGSDGTMNGFAGNLCASNFVCAAPPCNYPDNGLAPPVAVPTLGQWGLILLTLLLLTFGTVAIRSRQLVLAGTRNSNATFRQLPFDKILFVKILLPLSVLVLAVFSIAIGMFGYELTSADIPGSLVAVPLLAYLLHLLGVEE